MSRKQSLVAQIYDEIANEKNGRFDLSIVEERYLERLPLIDKAKLERDHAKQVVSREDDRRTKERDTGQLSLFADPDEFIKTAERERVRKSIARYPDVMAALSIKQENHALISAALSRETAIIAKLSKYLMNGMTWNEAAKAYERDQNQAPKAAD